MIKKSILAFFIFIMSACAERGSIIDAPVQATTYNKKIIDKKKSNIPTLILRAPKEDEIQNNISGGLILIIGFILIL